MLLEQDRRTVDPIPPHILLHVSNGIAATEEAVRHFPSELQPFFVREGEIPEIKLAYTTFKDTLGVVPTLTYTFNPLELKLEVHPWYSPQAYLRQLGNLLGALSLTPRWHENEEQLRQWLDPESAAKVIAMSKGTPVMTLGTMPYIYNPSEKVHFQYNKAAEQYLFDMYCAAYQSLVIRASRSVSMYGSIDQVAKLPTLPIDVDFFDLTPLLVHKHEQQFGGPLGIIKALRQLVDPDETDQWYTVNQLTALREIMVAQYASRLFAVLSNDESFQKVLLTKTEDNLAWRLWRKISNGNHTRPSIRLPQEALNSVNTHNHLVYFGEYLYELFATNPTEAAWLLKQTLTDAEPYLKHRIIEPS